MCIRDSTFTVKGLAECTTYSFRIKSFRKTESTTDFREYTAIKAATAVSGVKNAKDTSVTDVDKRQPLWRVMLHYEFTGKIGGERTDKFLALQDTGITRSAAAALIEQGCCCLLYTSIRSLCRILKAKVSLHLA